MVALPEWVSLSAGAHIVGAPTASSPRTVPTFIEDAELFDDEYAYNDIVKLVNHTKLGTVHVSKVKVDAAMGADVVVGSKLASGGELEGTNDTLSFSVTPTQGQSDADGSTFKAVSAMDATELEPWQGDSSGTMSWLAAGTTDELGNYSTSTNGEIVGQTAGINPVNPNQWNVAQKDRALALNGLSGRVGGFGSLSPLIDTEVGAVH